MTLRLSTYFQPQISKLPILVIISGLFFDVEVAMSTRVIAHTCQVCPISPVTAHIVIDELLLKIGCPYFFTPNQDGFNDTWNVIGLEDQESAKLFIFDRYGKLLKQLSTQGNGWDGTYNNNQMPSSDYWFTLEYNENGNQKKFGSHFSLKR